MSRKQKYDNLVQALKAHGLGQEYKEMLQEYTSAYGKFSGFEHHDLVSLTISAYNRSDAVLLEKLLDNGMGYLYYVRSKSSQSNENDVVGSLVERLIIDVSYYESGKNPAKAQCLEKIVQRISRVKGIIKDSSYEQVPISVLDLPVIIDGKLETPLGYAFSHGCVKMSKLLLDHGANAYAALAPECLGDIWWKHIDSSKFDNYVRYVQQVHALSEAQSKRIDQMAGGKQLESMRQMKTLRGQPKVDSHWGRQLARMHLSNELMWSTPPILRALLCGQQVDPIIGNIANPMKLKIQQMLEPQTTPSVHPMVRQMHWVEEEKNNVYAAVLSVCVTQSEQTEHSESSRMQELFWKVQKEYKDQMSTHAHGHEQVGSIWEYLGALSEKLPALASCVEGHLLPQRVSSGNKNMYKIHKQSIEMEGSVDRWSSVSQLKGFKKILGVWSQAISTLHTHSYEGYKHLARLLQALDDGVYTIPERLTQLPESLHPLGFLSFWIKVQQKSWAVAQKQVWLERSWSAMSGYANTKQGAEQEAYWRQLLTAPQKIGLTGVSVIEWSCADVLIGGAHEYKKIVEQMLSQLDRVIPTTPKMQGYRGVHPMFSGLSVLKKACQDEGGQWLWEHAPNWMGSKGLEYAQIMPSDWSAPLSSMVHKVGSVGAKSSSWQNTWQQVIGVSHALQALVQKVEDIEVLFNPVDQWNLESMITHLTCTEQYLKGYQQQHEYDHFEVQKDQQGEPVPVPVSVPMEALMQACLQQIVQSTGTLEVYVQGKQLAECAQKILVHQERMELMQSVSTESESSHGESVRMKRRL